MKGVFLEPPQVDVALTFFAFLAALVSLIGLFLVASYEATFTILSKSILVCICDSIFPDCILSN